MGFLGDLFSVGTALNRMAKSFDECLKCIALYRVTNETNEIYKAAWIYNFGIQASLEKWHWNPISTRIFIPNHQELGRITIDQAIMLVLRQISCAANQLGINQIIEDILDGGNAYQNYSFLISQQIKNKIKP